MPDFTQTKAILQSAIADGRIPAAQLLVRWRGKVWVDMAVGWLDPDTRQHPTQPDTLFDIASITKLFSALAFMTLVEQGELALDQPISSILSAFNGPRPIQPYEDPLAPGQMVTVTGITGTVDAASITFRHLLTHTSGLPAWRPLYKQPDIQAARRMALETFFSYRPGARVVYSDIGLILLGMTIERLTGQTLDTAVHERVIAPLNLQHTRYFPLSMPGVVGNVAPTESCPWRGRRMVGQVHDENAYQLGGVAAHAGLFSTARDIASLGQALLDCRKGSSRRDLALQAETVKEMTRLQTAGLGLRRGLAFMLWQPDPESNSNPFGQRAFGHSGFTGTTLWIDPDRDLVVALLTNEVYNGRQDRKIQALRIGIHKAIVEDVHS